MLLFEGKKSCLCFQHYFSVRTLKLHISILSESQPSIFPKALYVGISIWIPQFPQDLNCFHANPNKSSENTSILWWAKCKWYLTNKQNLWSFKLCREFRFGVLEIERDFMQILLYSSEAYHWAGRNPQMVKPDLWNYLLLRFWKKLEN